MKSDRIASEASKSPPEPPDHLSESSKALWRSLVPRRAKSPERLAMLIAGLEARDRADEARSIIARDGLTSVTKKTGMAHINPLVKIEREARMLFVKVFDTLGLKWDAYLDGRA